MVPENSKPELTSVDINTQKVADILGFHPMVIEVAYDDNFRYDYFDHEELTNELYRFKDMIHTMFDTGNKENVKLIYEAMGADKKFSRYILNELVGGCAERGTFRHQRLSERTYELAMLLINEIPELKERYEQELSINNDFDELFEASEHKHVAEKPERVKKLVEEILESETDTELKSEETPTGRLHRIICRVMNEGKDGVTEEEFKAFEVHFTSISEGIRCAVCGLFEEMDSYNFEELVKLLTDAREFRELKK